jgi:acetyl esterase
MSLDPTIQALFEQMPHLVNYPMWEKTPVEAREEFKAFCELADPKNIPIGKTDPAEAQGPAGAIALRIYTPVAAGAGVLPAIVYFHGGGFVVGNLDTGDAICRMLANESHSRVVSVDYRLAPENKFPAAVDDCFAATKWVEEKATAPGIDANRLAVAGDSAGATLAAVTALRAKENNGSPHIAFQLLIYPATQMGGVSAERAHASGYLLDSRTIDWFQAQYLPQDADPADPRISPLAANDLGGLPPTYMITAGFDPLREEGIAYAEKLRAAGVPVTHIDYPTMVHGFISMLAFVPIAGEALSVAAHAIRDGLK